MLYSEDIDAIDKAIESTNQKLIGLSNKLTKQSKLSIQEQTILDLVNTISGAHVTQLDLIKNTETNTVVPSKSSEVAPLLFSLVIIVVTILSFVIGMQLAIKTL